MNTYGIDYGRGTTNIDKATGMRYGVVPMNALVHWAWDEIEADYGEPTCPKCGAEASEYDHDEHWEYEGHCRDYACEGCEYRFASDHAFPDEPHGHTLDSGGIKATVGGNGIDMFILESPYYTHAQFCSPCAPGACYLLNPTDKSGPHAYCLPHDWFEGGKAPYPVWEVATGKLVRPEKAK